MSALCLSLDCYYVAVLFYVFLSLKSLSGSGNCLSLCLSLFFVILDLRQAASALASCAFLLRQFQNFGSWRKTSQRRGTARATPLRCSLTHYSKRGCAQAELGRAATLKRQTCSCERSGRELTACSWKTAWMWNRESEIVARDVIKLFFRNPGSQGHSVPTRAAPLFSFLSQVLHCDNTQGLFCWPAVSHINPSLSW